MTPGLLKATGRALYGHHWRAPMAGAFNVARERVDSWADRRALPPPGMAEQLAIMVLDRERQLRVVFRELDRERRKP